MKKIFITVCLLLLLTGCAEDPQRAEPVTRNINPPVIEIIGDSNVFLEKSKGEYVELGATATDNFDPEVEVVVSGVDAIDTDTIGEYVISYDAVDSFGNVAETVTRSVFVTNKQPGIISTFAFEAKDGVGFMVQYFDLDESLISLNAYLYEGEEVVRFQEITSSRESFEFWGLKSNVDYTFKLVGVMDLGGDLGTVTFEKGEIQVGTYSRLDDDFKEDLNDDELFEALYNYVYMPYNNTKLQQTLQMVRTLSRVDKELLEYAYNSGDYLVFTIGYASDIYEWKDWSTESFKSICCNPCSVQIGYSGWSMDVTLSTFAGSIVDVSWGELALREEFYVLYETEFDLLFEGDPHFDDPYWYFKEAFVYYYFSDASRAELLEKAPGTYAYMADLLNIIDTLE